MIMDVTWRECRLLLAIWPVTHVLGHSDDIESENPSQGLQVLLATQFEPNNPQDMQLPTEESLNENI